MHTINILYLNRRISFINGDKYKKNIEKQEELDTKKSYQKKTFAWHKYITASEINRFVSEQLIFSMLRLAFY